MSLLRKLFQKQPPQWAHFFSGTEFDHFLSVLRAQLASRGIPHRLDAREGVVQVQTGGQTGAQALGLLNLAQVCRGAASEAWPEIVREHLDLMLVNTAQWMGQVDTLADNFEAARPLIRVRLQPGDYAQQLENAVSSQPIAEDLLAVLVYDFPDSIASVHPDHVVKWGVPMHDLVQLGVRNTWAEGRLEAERIDVGEGAWFDVYESGENYYAASHALLLHEYLQPEPAYGTLVAVPTRHVMVVRPIEDATAIRALHAMLYFVPGLYEQGPGSIVPHVYWHRHGVFTRLPFQKKGEQITFSPPASFTEQVLEKLGVEG